VRTESRTEWRRTIDGGPPELFLDSANSTRNWVFRKALSPSSSSVSANLPDPITPSGPAFSKTSAIGNVHTRIMKQTAVTLFRFSALTFNPHKIHYSLPWARDVEGHRDIVVHGPLNLINILDLWRDTRTSAPSSKRQELVLPQSISYRATNPLYAEEEYRLVLEDDGGVARVQVIGPDGITVAMKAEIKS
jgi:hydroxyacyl-ACP dehydratase HTD2-like protein with hotdog domain